MATQVRAQIQIQNHRDHHHHHHHPSNHNHHQQQQQQPRIFRLDGLDAAASQGSLPWPGNHADYIEPAYRRLRPSQVALPLRTAVNANQQHGQRHADKSGILRHDALDTMLRRKTPGGTLSGAYDGAPTGLGLEGVHATKRLVMQDAMRRSYRRSQSSQRLGLQSASTHGRRASIEARQNLWPLQQQQQQQQQQRQQNLGMPGHWQNALHTGAQPTRLDQLPSYSTRSLQFDQYGHQQVMQPPGQMALEPTVSNALGPYGPYWPNGTFVPYRPASARASHWSHSHPHPQHMAEGQTVPSSWNAQTWQSLPPRPDSNYLYGPFLGVHDASHQLLSHMQNYSIDDASSLPQDNGYGQPSFAQSSATTKTNAWNQSALAATSGKPKSVKEQFPNPEALLHAAHQIYDRLVAAIHSARRSGRRHSQPGPRPNRPDIYPVPSRRSSINSRHSIAKESCAHPQQQQQQQRHAHVSLQRLFSDPAGSQLQAQLPTLQNQHDSRLPARDGIDPRRHQAALIDVRQRNRGAQAQGFDCSDACLGASPESTIPAAWSILSALDEAIVDSSGRWVDGMQLAACMCYMLGDYSKAIDWNTRLLALEPDHVEATSNLAATLLALGHRAEAEAHWKRVVDLKPAYFEAVEHLVGLLCFDNRHKEAVQIIEAVQLALSPQELDTNLQLTKRGKGRFSSSARYSNDAQDNGRIMALVHAKANVLYNMRDQSGAAKAFEEVVLIAVGQPEGDIGQLIGTLLKTLAGHDGQGGMVGAKREQMLLLSPEKALHTARLCFGPHGLLPGLVSLPSPMSLKAAVSVTSNSLLSLAKIFQDNLNPNASSLGVARQGCSVQDILVLYYLSLSLQPSPSTANNVGILLASVEPTPAQKLQQQQQSQWSEYPSVLPGSGVALALEYYRYGLSLDNKHAHLFTNFGSLLKDIGQLPRAIQMYEQAVACDGTFDIALANLANAVKDQGRANEAIMYYRRAVEANPKFAEAVCGLANALNSVCNWAGRGGAALAGGQLDRWHVGEAGELVDSQAASTPQLSGWIKRVIDIVDRQLKEGEIWGRDLLHDSQIEVLCSQMCQHHLTEAEAKESASGVRALLRSWVGKPYEGARIVRLVERAIRQIMWQWYQDRYVLKREQAACKYSRPALPAAMTVPNAPTVLPFHTFTFPMTAKQIRLISQRNGLRVSCSTLKAPWLPKTVFRPPAPPAPQLIVGYVSSDFNNHPLAHLMQSVFGMHNQKRVKAICYATTPSDNSLHRQQIEREAPVFHDASSWPVEGVVRQIVNDGCHILVNLNGYTRGARNEIFAARPAPIQMSFMGFAGTLGAEWCDYLLADEVAVPPSTLRPHRSSVNVADVAVDESYASTASEENTEWMYAENIIYTRATFFCCDHAQSSVPSFASAADGKGTFADELSARQQMRRQLFPDLPPSAVILANFNQLYKIDPSTFRTWLRILGKLPNAILWLLRFPESGEAHLRQTALSWARPGVANRVRFTDVAPKAIHISRAAAADLFLDTPECNAHTTAADCLWSGTPLLTLPRYKWKMCSRMAASILAGSLGVAADGRGRETQLRSGDAAVAERVRTWDELVVSSEDEYEATAVRLGQSLQHCGGGDWKLEAGGFGECRLLEMRHTLFCARKFKHAALFDTRRWVRDLEAAYDEVWARWVRGEGGDISLRELCGDL